MASSSVYRAVLVDDVTELRHLMRLLLERTGRFDIVGEAGDGATGVATVAQHRPDVVLLDLSMPVMDGLEALPLMLDVAPSCRVVVVSGFEADRMAARAVALGAAGYLTKGLGPDGLVRALLGLLESPPPMGAAGSAGPAGPAGRPGGGIASLVGRLAAPWGRSRLRIPAGLGARLRPA